MSHQHIKQILKKQRQYKCKLAQLISSLGTAKIREFASVEEE